VYFKYVTSLQNRLKPLRLKAELSQQELARLAGISRQAYSALESGSANPSTQVALRLARALGTTVDSLFSLAEDLHEGLQAELIGGDVPGAIPNDPEYPSRVQVMRVGGRLLARTLSGVWATRQTLVNAEGLMLSGPGPGNRVLVQPYDPREMATPSLCLMGCDPAGALLEQGLRRQGVRLVWSEEGSHQALAGLARGEAHVAGCHLKDDATGRYNHFWVSRLVPFPCTLVTFATWQQGLMVAPGNPKGIQRLADLARPEVRIVNRQLGSGSRALLDRLLEDNGIPHDAVKGYQHEARGHLAVASAIASGLVDAGVGVAAAAGATGLGFVPLEEERYDLVIPNHFLDEPGVQVLLDLLRQPVLQHRVESLGGYDVSSMGFTVSDD